MLKIDLHIHSIFSGHAYGTFYEIIDYAAKKKMNTIAISDHGPAVTGQFVRHHFDMGPRAPKTYKGVRILWGCEANPIDHKGNIDLREKTKKKLGCLLIGLHDDGPFKDKGKKKNTIAFIKCLKKHMPHIVTHPSRKFYDCDVEKICQAACDLDILLEISIGQLIRLEHKGRGESLEDMKTVVKVAKRNKKKIIINTDAHFLHEIGDDTILKKYIKRLGLTKDMIINNYPKELEKLLKRKL